MSFNFSNIRLSKFFSRTSTGQGRSVIGEIKPESSTQSGNFQSLRKIALMVVFSVLMVVGVQGAAKTASVTGVWSSTATWGGSAVPVAGDNIIVK